MKKRSCERFSIPGTVVHYKVMPRFLGTGQYSRNYYPVLNLSRGGAMFLCDQRLQAGAMLTVKLMIPGIAREYELLGDVRWIARNPEQSYRYRIGVAFSAYGTGKQENPLYLLDFLKELEAGVVKKTEL